MAGGQWKLQYPLEPIKIGGTSYADLLKHNSQAETLRQKTFQQKNLFRS
jgi:hypothetical protein